MKFIGLFLMLISAIALERGFSFSNLIMFIIGLAFLFSEVIFYAMKKEIDHRHRRR
jgi:hypothetical protein